MILNNVKLHNLVTKLRNLARVLLAIPVQGSGGYAPNNPPDYGDNQVINHPRLRNSKIVFKGTGNILYFESADHILQDSKLSFEGDNSVIYISKHNNKNRNHRISIYAQTDTTVYVGKNTNFHPGGRSMMNMTVGESKNIIIGDDCLFSLDVQFRTSDGHAAYNATTGERLNHARSIMIGDHVWVGQGVTILKGSRVGSGSIVGAGAILTGKTYPSNSSIAGVPAKVLQHGVFFTKPNVNGYSKGELESIKSTANTSWIYEHSDSTVDFGHLDTALSSASTGQERLTILRSRLANNHPKNRFHVG